MTFQEYFAAHYLAERFAEETESKQYLEAVNCLKKHKFNPHYEVIWGFVAGLVQLLGQSTQNKNDTNQAVNAFWETWMVAPCNLIGFKELELVDRLLVESDTDKPILIQAKWSRIVKAHMKKYLERAKYLFGIENKFTIVPQSVMRDLFSDCLKQIESGDEKKIVKAIMTLMEILLFVPEVHISSIAREFAKEAISTCISLLQKESLEKEFRELTMIVVVCLTYYETQKTASNPISIQLDVLNEFILSSLVAIVNPSKIRYTMDEISMNLIKALADILIKRVVRVLDRVSEWRGYPKQLRMDNGPEFISSQLIAWCNQHSIEMLHIQPGNQNAYIERFNRTFGQGIECIFIHH